MLINAITPAGSVPRIGDHRNGGAPPPPYYSSRLGAAKFRFLHVEKHPARDLSGG